MCIRERKKEHAREKEEEGKKGRREREKLFYISHSHISWHTVMLLILNWVKITQDWIELSLTLFSYLLYLTLLLLGLHYESAGEKTMLSQMDRSEGDFMLLKLELNQDCVPLFGAVLLSFRWRTGLEQLISFSGSSYSLFF